ncbi:chitin synthase III catalytic subunit-domain-containing protein [Xylariales sp. PMI_506]|nr:chitin synthase III catalytic subunit-domain-containing protein [Xylariales sp. PMI_506]
MQVFILLYLLVSMVDIFVTGRFLDSVILNTRIAKSILLALSSVEIALIVATSWVLFPIGFVCFQLMDDGTPASIAMLVFSASVLFGGTLYISLDTGFNFTRWFLRGADSYSPALLVLYLGVPLVSLTAYSICQVVFSVRLGRIPWYLIASLTAFAVGQLFEFVIGSKICAATHGALDGAFFQSLFSLIALVTLCDHWETSGAAFHEEDGQAGSGHCAYYQHSSTFSQSKQEPFTQTQEVPQLYLVQPEGLSMTDSLSALDVYKTQFLDRVESEVYNMILNSSKTNLTAVVATFQNGSQANYNYHDHLHWGSRIWTMVQQRDQLDKSPPGLIIHDDGAELESWVSANVLKKVTGIYNEFFKEHEEVVIKHQIGSIQRNPEVQKQIAVLFTGVAREAGKPMTKKMSKALAHLIRELLSQQTPSALNAALTSALAHISAPMVVRFSQHLAHALAPHLGQMMTHLLSPGAIHSLLVGHLHALGPKAAVALLSYLGVHLSHQAASHSFFAAAGAVSLVGHVAAPAVLVWLVKKKLDKMPTELAGKVAPLVRGLLEQNFTETNTKVLAEAAKGFAKDGAKKLAWELFKDSTLGEMVTEVADELVQAAEREGGVLKRHLLDDN